MTYYKSSIVNFKILKKQKNVRHKNQWKYFLNKNVLSFVLNLATLSAFLTDSGIVFHKWGVAAENARPPYVLDFMAGVHNSERDDDRSALDGWYSLIRDSRYPADCPFKILYVIRRILKWILASTGSQCRLFNKGVMWSELRAPVIIRAAVFWILCNLSLWYFGMSYKRLLQ